MLLLLLLLLLLLMLLLLLLSLLGEGGALGGGFHWGGMWRCGKPIVAVWGERGVNTALFIRAL